MGLDANQRAVLAGAIANALPDTGELEAFVDSVKLGAWARVYKNNFTHHAAANAIVKAAAGGGWLRDLVVPLKNKFPNIPEFGELLPAIDARGTDEPLLLESDLPDASAGVEPESAPAQVNAGVLRNVNAGSIVNTTTVNYYREPSANPAGVAKEFVLELSKETYTPNTGWPCPALSIPGAKVKHVLIAGQAQALEGFSFSGGYIRRIKDSQRKEDAAVTIELTKQLVTLNTPIIVAIVGALATIVAAFISSGSKAAGGTNCPETKRLEIVLDDSTRSLTDPTNEQRAIVRVGERDSKLSYSVQLDGVGRVVLPWNGLSVGAKPATAGERATVEGVPSGARIRLSELTLFRHTADGDVNVGPISCTPKDGGFLCTAHDKI